MSQRFAKVELQQKKSLNDPKRTNERCARIAKKIGPNISAPANFRLSNSI